MKSLNFALLFLLLISFQSFPNSYWQQKVKYFIEVDIDIRNNKFHGKEDLIYYNNSTDTLKNVFFHLYYNAFQPGSMMDVRSRNLPDPDRRVMDKISNLKDDQIGYHKILYLKQNGENLRYADIQFKRDREIVMVAVSQNGENLRYADIQFKKDREIVMAAVKQNGLNLIYTNNYF